jgi:hypothetical protein
MQRHGFPLFAWWYVAIAVGFWLLAINRALAREQPWLVALRLVIGIGFALLAALEFRTTRGGR